MEQHYKTVYVVETSADDEKREFATLEAAMVAAKLIAGRELAHNAAAAKVVASVDTGIEGGLSWMAEDYEGDGCIVLGVEDAAGKYLDDIVRVRPWIRKWGW